MLPLSSEFTLKNAQPWQFRKWKPFPQAVTENGEIIALSEKLLRKKTKQQLKRSRQVYYKPE
jgi:hypothetical protein